MKPIGAVLITALVLFLAFWAGCLRQQQQGFKIIEFHSEGEVDGYCYITAQLGTALDVCTI